MEEGGSGREENSPRLLQIVAGMVGLSYNRAMWDEIPGNDDIKAILKEYCAAGKIPHALLFAGPCGSGKTRTAFELFKALNCAAGGGEACSKCSSCMKIVAENHPDVSVVRPEKRWIKIDEHIRPLIAEMALKPFEGRMRCVLIEPAESLTTESSNALLKTLEEPPPQTVIVLISHMPALLLPTVISRCTVLRFTQGRGEQKTTSEGYPLTGPAGMKDAQVRLREEIVGLLSGGDPVGLALRCVDEGFQEGIAEILETVESAVRDLLVLRLGASGLLNERLRSIHVRQPYLWEIDDVMEAVSEIRRGSYENINLRVAVTDLFIRFARLGSA